MYMYVPLGDLRLFLPYIYNLKMRSEHYFGHQQVATSVV